MIPDTARLDRRWIFHPTLNRDSTPWFKQARNDKLLQKLIPRWIDSIEYWIHPSRKGFHSEEYIYANLESAFNQLKDTWNLSLIAGDISHRIATRFPFTLT